MNLYPFTTPLILTDAIYEAYGGNTGTATAAQRQAAYQMAEEQAWRDMDTFLLPVKVTGTFVYNPTHGALILDYTYISAVHRVEFIDTQEDVYWSQNGTDNVYVSLRDDTYGLVDLHYLVGNCHCATSVHPYPYQIRVVYTAGLPTGTANHPDVLLALTTYAQIILNEIIGFGNESPGDIGVQEFRNQQYSENRVYLFKTAWGSSPKAHLAQRLLTKFRKRKMVGL